jgi:hypothetical protein
VVGSCEHGNEPSRSVICIIAQSTSLEGRQKSSPIHFHTTASGLMTLHFEKPITKQTILSKRKVHEISVRLDPLNRSSKYVLHCHNANVHKNDKDNFTKRSSLQTSYINQFDWAVALYKLSTPSLLKTS